MVKKICVTMAVVALSVGVAHANLVYAFGMPGGFYWAGAPGTGFLGSGQSATIQFNLAPDGVPDNILPGGGFQQQGGALDINLFTFTITEGANTVPSGGGPRPIDSFGWFSTGEFTSLDPFDAGGTHDTAAMTPGAVVYGQVFQDNTIQANEYFYRGLLDTAIVFVDPTVTPPQTPGTYSLVRFGSSESLGLDEGQINGAFSHQVVPEPGTWALFAMGILTLAGVKFRSRK